MLRPAPSLVSRKGKESEWGFLFLSMKLPLRPNSWRSLPQQVQFSLELRGQQKTPETETMKPPGFPEETGPPQTFLKRVITDPITSQENGLRGNEFSEVSERFPCTENIWTQDLGFASGTGKMSGAILSSGDQSTVAHDWPCGLQGRRQGRACSPLLYQLLTVLHPMTLCSHSSWTATSPAFTAGLAFQKLNPMDSR